MAQDVIDIINGLLGAMGITDARVEELSDDMGTTYMIKVPEGRMLIGYQGANLTALNHIVKRIIERKTGEYGRFSLDVNEYQHERNESLRQRARMIADRVRSLASDTEFEPMDAYERMVIHAVLAESPEIRTESTGRGRDRRVVVKYEPKKSNTEIY
ncbi:MAG: hypothetical protein HGA67_01200 [Candidatus Yonathbacteria bacterium]|nr:hypothetical protein [Candidatus Yonathbacteria bacterium]